MMGFDREFLTGTLESLVGNGFQDGSSQRFAKGSQFPMGMMVALRRQMIEMPVLVMSWRDQQSKNTASFRVEKQSSKTWHTT